MRRGVRPAGAWVLLLVVLGACVVRTPPPTRRRRFGCARSNDVVPRMSPAWDSTHLTCPGTDAGGCLAAASAEPVVVPGADGAKYLLGAW